MKFPLKPHKQILIGVFNERYQVSKNEQYRCYFLKGEVRSEMDPWCFLFQTIFYNFQGRSEG